MSRTEMLARGEDGLDAGGAMAAPDPAGTWIADSLVLVLRATALLSAEAARRPDPQGARAVRDLADQAVIWADLLDGGEESAVETGVVPATLLARLAAGLLDRLATVPGGRSPELGRTALICATDLRRLLARAETSIRAIERAGGGESLRAARSDLPSRSEFRRGPDAVRPLAPARPARRQRAG